MAETIVAASNSGVFWKRLALSPWGVATILQLPYAVLYLYYLWPHTHYQFFPLLLAAVGYFIHTRCSVASPTQPINRLAFVLGTAGLVTAVAATGLVSAWLGYLGCVLTLSACLSQFSDRVDGRPLSYLAWPLIIAWQPPYSDLTTADTHFITYLQQCSARWASSLLDVLGVTHYYFGNIIELPVKSFSVEQGCSGVQSFFAIVCVSALMSVAFRRGVVHSIILTMSSIFWTILMNTLRITLIPIAALALGVDLSHGTAHQILGFGAMGLATWMLLASDQFLFHALSGSPGKPTLKPATVGQTVVTTTNAAGFRWTQARIGVCGLMGLLTIVQLVDLQRKTFRLFGGNVFLELSADDLPRSVGNFSLVDYQLERRTTDADFGERSDVWRYTCDDGVVFVSLDQTFRLWHDLLVCYKNAGWQLQSDKVVFGQDETWPMVLAGFERADGRHAALVFGLFDRAGLPLEVPGHLDLWSATKVRLAKRFSPAAGELFREQTCYQVQAFRQSESPCSESQLSELIALFEEVRSRLRQAGLKRLEP